MPRIIFIILVILISASVSSCRIAEPTAEERIAEITSFYEGLVEEYGPYYPDDPGVAGWPYQYHPILYAAWVFEGGKSVNRDLESRLREGFVIYTILQNDLAAQVAESGTNVDKIRSISLIDDLTLKSETEALIDEGIIAPLAFARIWMAPIMEDYPDAPAEMLILLGKIYDGHPELCQRADETSVAGEDVIWRNWLHVAIAACGSEGIRTVLEFDRSLEDLQEIVPFDDLWAGQNSIPYNLRCFQFARAEALDESIEHLGRNRDGGEVGGLDAWLYWNLAWTADSSGGMFLYPEDDYRRVEEFLLDGVMEGPPSKGEEAWIVAERMADFPSPELADVFLDLVEDPEISCERKVIGIWGLIRIYEKPVSGWSIDPDETAEIRTRSVDILSIGPLQCGNEQLLELIAGVASGFSDDSGQHPEVDLTGEEMVDLHFAFKELLPQLETADERARGLGVASFSLAPPGFLDDKPELSDYRDVLLQVHDEWSESTSFEDSDISESDFGVLLMALRMTLGDEENPWEEE